MYRAANSLDPDGVEAVSRLAFLEMVEAGFTSVGEFHYLHRNPDGTPYDDPDELALRVIRAARDVGIRIHLLRVIYAAGGIGAPLGRDQQRFRTDSVAEALAAVERLHGSEDGVTAGVAPHSVRAVPPSWWGEIGEFEGTIHSHVAEQPAEVADCRARTGRSPLQLIAGAGALSGRFTAVHLTHPDATDLELMRSSGARIAVCPSTELDLGDGFLPVAAREGIRCCIGTDSHARIDPFDEIRSLEMHARALSHKRLVMGTPGDRHSLAEALLRAGTIEGARALDLESGIRTGAPADLIEIDLDRPGALGVPPLEATVLAGDPSWVSKVWVGGEQIVREGQHPRRRQILEAALPYLQQ